MLFFYQENGTLLVVFIHGVVWDAECNATGGPAAAAAAADYAGLS
jgi:hypothetical protein